jgi:hypothetical protein
MAMAHACISLGNLDMVHADLPAALIARSKSLFP